MLLGAPIHTGASNMGTLEKLKRFPNKVAVDIKKLEMSRISTLRDGWRISLGLPWIHWILHILQAGLNWASCSVDMGL